MTSSLRNSLHRRNHKERSQLTHRARFGFLEKHKDYVLRARDYHSKQDRLQRLRQKAAERNRDEFYFGMYSQRTKGGVHIQDRGNQALPADMVKVLKTQDENYVRTMRTAGLKKIDKLKNQLSTLADLVKSTSLNGAAEEDNDPEGDEMKVLKEAGIVSTGSGSSRRKRKVASAKHIIFVDDETAARQYNKKAKTTADVPVSNVDASTSTSSVDLGWKELQSKPPKKKKQKQQAMQDRQEADVEEVNLDKERSQLAEAHRSRLLKELSARLTRDKQLRYAGRELEMQRLMMGKGGRKKLHGIEKVEADEDEDDDDSDDVADRKTSKPVDEKAYKPRVYKWRMERKR